MKNLNKFLLTLSLVSLPAINAFSQEKDYNDFADLPFKKSYISPEFWFYQNPIFKERVDTLGKYTVCKEPIKKIYNEIISLDINKDSLEDVLEVYWMRKIDKEDLINFKFPEKCKINKDSTEIRTIYPWGYFFFKQAEDGSINLERWWDFEIDGIDRDEWRQEELEYMNEFNSPTKKTMDI